MSWSWAQYRLPLAMPTTAGGGLERRGLILSWDGAWGEAAPLPGLHDEALENLPARLEKLDLPECLPAGTPGEILARLIRTPGFGVLPPSLRFGLESAALQYAADCGDLPLSRFLWPGKPLEAPRSVGLFSGDADEAASLLDAGAFSSYSGVKLKVGRSTLDEDVRVAGIFRDRWPAAEIRLDANRSFDLSTMRELCTRTADLDIAFVEEPFADRRDLAAWLQSDAGLPVALDETVVAALRGGDLPPSGPRVAAWVVKPSCVGVFATLQLMADVQPTRVIVSSSFESSVGMGMLRALSSGSSAAPGLGTDRWFPHELTEDHLGAWRALPGGRA